MGYAGLPGDAVDGLMKRDFAPAADRLRSVIARLSGDAGRVRGRAGQRREPAEGVHRPGHPHGQGLGRLLRAHGRRAGRRRPPAATPRCSRSSRPPTPPSSQRDARRSPPGSKNDLLPRSKGSYAIGAENFLAKLQLRGDGRACRSTELLASGEANLAKDHEAFVATARQIDPTKTPGRGDEGALRRPPDGRRPDPLGPAVDRGRAAVPGREEDRHHPVRGAAADRGDAALRPRRQLRLDGHARARSRRRPPRRSTTSRRSRRTGTPQHKEEHLRLFNPPVVAMINVHEAFPGHYLQFLYAKQFPTKTRKLIFCGTNVEGWAHYTEQMMVDEGFGGGDPKIRLAQLQEALLRDCRYVVGIKLHTAGHDRRGGGQGLRGEGLPGAGQRPTRRPAAAPTTRPTSTTRSASSRSRSCATSTCRRRRATPPRLPRRVRAPGRAADPAGAEDPASLRPRDRARNRREPAVASQLTPARPAAQRWRGVGVASATGPR